MKKRSSKYQSQERYFQKAKRENYLARSVYKLEEINGKYKLLKNGCRVLDLGCVPGSWLQYCAARVGDEGLVVGVDCSLMAHEIAPNVHFIQQDINLLEPTQIAAFCPEFDLVLSDMAPATSGIKSLDQERSLQLVYSACKLAHRLLKPGGNLLVKLFQGEGVKELLDCLKIHFARVKTIKPKTSSRSRLEIYILAQDKRKGESPF